MDNRCLHQAPSEKQEYPVYTDGFLENSYVDNRHPPVALEPTQWSPSLGPMQPDHAAPLWTTSPGFDRPNFFAPPPRGEGLGLYRMDLPYGFDPSVPPPSFGCPPPRHMVNMVPSAPLNVFSGLPQFKVGPPAPSDGFQSAFVSGENQQQEYDDYRDRGRVSRMKSAHQRMQDTQWLRRFCQSRAKLSKNTQIQDRPRHCARGVHVLRETLYEAVQLVSAIEESHRSLKDNTENDCAWTESQSTVLKMKGEFQEKLKLLSDGDCLNRFKAKLSRAAQSRARRLRASNQMQQEERDRQEEIAEKEAAIDTWRMKQINQVREKMQEQELKLAADLVLCEVRKKQADVKRMQDILRSLEKLRRLRKEAASRKGIISEEACDKGFSSRLEWLRSVMKRRTVVYSAEEKALMVMLEGEQEEERRRKQEGQVKEESEKQLKNKRRVDTILFGDDDVASVLQPFRKYYTQAQRSMHALIRVRREWDVFTIAADHPDGSSVPQSWIIPDPPSHLDWASTLHTS